MTKADNKKQARIDPEKEYTITMMVRERVFPWIDGSERNQYREYAAIIRADFIGENVLGAVRVPQGQKQAYFIRGRALMEFIKQHGKTFELIQRIKCNKKLKQS